MKWRQVLCTYVLVYVYIIHICMYVCMYVCMHVRIYNIYINVYMYIYDVSSRCQDNRLAHNVIDLHSDCRDYGHSPGPWFSGWLYHLYMEAGWTIQWSHISHIKRLRYPLLGIPMSHEFAVFEVRLPQRTFRYLAECRIFRKGANSVSSALGPWRWHLKD